MVRHWILPLAALTLAACAAPQQGGPHAGHMGHMGHSGASSDPGTVRWHSLAEGRELAWVQEKPMLVEFYVPEGCHRCDRMNKEVYADEEIARVVNERFVPVRIDLTGTLTREEAELGRRYDYQYECLLLFLDSEGELIENAGGGRMCFAEFVNPEWFKQYLDRAATVAGSP